VPLLPVKFRCRPVACLVLIVLALPAHAGSIFFNLSLNGNTLTLTNQGDSTAFYPAVLRLLPDGRWESLAPPAGIEPSAELLPGATLDLNWPTPSPEQQAFPLEIFRPYMVRFFDQAGSSFGQISFFMQPPAATNLLQAHYDDGLLTLIPPGADGADVIHASWLLWPQEEGIEPLAAALAFEHSQPPAQRIEWQSSMAPLHLNLGAGLPTAMLLHESNSGFTLQTVPGGGLQGTQQRAGWLSANETFYTLAGAIAAAASVLLLWLFAAARRARKAP
jgi:hypothetical protein